MDTARCRTMTIAVACALILGALALAPAASLAHCDGLDGPVVRAARQALEKSDVTCVLVWVQPKDEAEVRHAFEQAVAVRELGPQARALSDTYFFETLVRLHRAGEAAPYTGLKPAGRDLGPAIPAADRALESGDVEPLVRLLANAVADGVRSRFAEARRARAGMERDVASGRAYVGHYVPFLHYVEGIYNSATVTPAGHEEERVSQAGETN